MAKIRIKDSEGNPIEGVTFFVVKLKDGALDDAAILECTTNAEGEFDIQFERGTRLVVFPNVVKAQIDGELSLLTIVSSPVLIVQPNSTHEVEYSDNTLSNISTIEDMLATVTSQVESIADGVSRLRIEVDSLRTDTDKLRSDVNDQQGRISAFSSANIIDLITRT